MTFPNSYLGAVKLSTPIGRDDTLQEIKGYLNERGQSYLLHLVGKGGMGKTFLLQYLYGALGGDTGKPITSKSVGADHESAQNSDNPLENKFAPGCHVLHSPTMVVDFYFVETTSIVGFIGQMLKHALRDGMITTKEALEEYRQAVSHGASDVAEKRKALAMAFKTDYAKLAQTKRMVWLLDTAERLFYSPPSAILARLLRPEDALLDTQTWLLEFLKEVPNTVVILAGRETKYLTDNLTINLEKASIKYKRLELKGLSPQNTVAYLTQIADHVETQKQLILEPRAAKALQRQAQILKEFIEKHKRLIHPYTGGVPIRLALLADLVLEGRGSLSAFTNENLFVPENGLPEAVERQLVEELRTLNRPEDEILRCLSLARRGLTAKHLKAVLQSRIGDQNWDEHFLHLQRLAIVKVQVPPEGQDDSETRYFLHDEVYDLLQKHWLLSEPERADWYKSLQTEAQKDLADAAQTLKAELLMRAKESIPLPNTFDSDPPELLRLRRQYHQRLLENLHYQLLMDLEAGLYEHYYELSILAFIAESEEFDFLIRQELNSLLHTPLSWGEILKDGQWDTLQDLVARDVVLQWLRCFIIRRDHTRVESFIADITREPECQLWLDDPLFAVEFESWSLFAKVDPTRDKGRIIEQFDTLLERFKGFGKSARLNSNKAHEAKRWQNVLGRIYNNRGYAQAQLINYSLAEADYKEAIRYFRRSNCWVELANSLNNCSYALAHQGNLPEAEHLCKDGLELRLNHLPSMFYQLGLSYNTLASIYNLKYDGYRARNYAERARWLFSQTHRPRGLGLANVCLGEALRRWLAEEYADVTSIPNEHENSVWREAEIDLQRAIEVFAPDSRTHEPVRYTSALIEIGSLYRDWARRLLGEARMEKINAAEQNLLKAIDFAKGTKDTSDDVDAILNLGWLYFYFGKENLLQERLDELTYKGEDKGEKRKLIPLECWFEKGLGNKWMPAAKHADHLLHLSKLYGLKAEQAGRKEQEAQQFREQEISKANQIAKPEARVSVKTPSSLPLTETHRAAIEELAEYTLLGVLYLLKISHTHPRLDAKTSKVFHLLRTWGPLRQRAFAQALKASLKGYGSELLESYEYLEAFLNKTLGFPSPKLGQKNKLH